jgi:anti-sigma B factor antagonist
MQITDRQARTGEMTGMNEADRNVRFEVEISREGAAPIVRVAGELDMAAAPRMRAVLGEMQGGGTSEVVVDLRGLTFLDSTGLSALVGAELAGRDGQAPVRFIRGSARVQRVFELTRMDERVEWLPES